MILYLIPGYDKPCPVGTEYGIRSVFKITFRIIADFPHNFLCIMADVISLQRAEHSAKSAGICRKLFLITSHFRYRGTACKNCQLTLCLRTGKRTVHPLDIIHRLPYIFHGKLHTEIIIRLQKDTPGFHQSLADRPVCGLTEISALRVLLVRPP